MKAAQRLLHKMILRSGSVVAEWGLHALRLGADIVCFPWAFQRFSVTGQGKLRVECSEAG